MSRVRARAYNLVTKVPSEEELLRRRQAEGRHTGLIGGLNGELLEPARSPTAAPSQTGWQAEEDTID
jgi:hypothetical protein